MSPCCAYAIALDAEKTITRPIPISAATEVKSTVSGGARVDARVQPASRCAMHRPAPVTPRPPPRTGRHDLRPTRTCRTTRSPARARRSRPAPRAHARAARLLPSMRLRSWSRLRGPANFIGRFADRDQCARALANLGSEFLELRSLRAAAGNQDDRRSRKCLARR